MDEASRRGYGSVHEVVPHALHQMEEVLWQGTRLQLGYDGTYELKAISRIGHQGKQKDSDWINLLHKHLIEKVKKSQLKWTLTKYYIVAYSANDDFFLSHGNT